jgi:arabinan endo-1,5-alpha-L-arabinosidase
VTTRRILLKMGLLQTGLLQAGLLATPAAAMAQVAGELAAPEATPHPEGESFGDHMSGDLAFAHDPCIMREGDTVYVYCSDTLGMEGDQHMPLRSSKDLLHWTSRGAVFDHLPQWAKEAVPGTKGMWAPDISIIGDRYHLYYACSTFGSNGSAIGLATNTTLNPDHPDYRWRDDGLVFMSGREDDYNCIDPAQFEDAHGQHWLAFGSFWGGIKMIRIDPATGKPRPGDREVVSLAHRPAPVGAPDAIEAAFVFRRKNWFYLFASYDYCCKGVNSSYYLVVGRARSPQGPYVGRDGREMLNGYGTVVLRGDARWRGPGHNAVLHDGDRDYIVYHAYDVQDHGISKLRISPIVWTADDWPTARL